MKLITILLTAMIVSLLLIGCSGGGGSGGSSSGGGTDNRSGDSGIIDGDGNGGDNRSGDNGVIGDDNRSGDSGIIDGDGNGGDNRSGDNGVIGGDNRSGDGGIIDGDGNGGELNIPAQAEWTIVPLAGGLSIQWHNLNNFTQMNALQRLSINLTRSDTSVKQTHTIDISDFINGIYQLTGLEDGIAYKFASMIELEYGGSISHNRPISLLLEFNRLDNVGNGIVVGVDNDRDGRADSIDDDDDNDGEPDIVDIDDDGDGLIEIGTAEELDAVRWVLDGTGFKANETAMLDQTGCGDGVDITVCNGYELEGDIYLTDYIADNYPMVGWQPIAHDVNTNAGECQGSQFTGIFDGNSFEVRGLFINRSKRDCIGLFGQVSNGKVLNLGVVADKIIGRSNVGILAGSSVTTSIVQSYGVSSLIRGGAKVGGLIGVGGSTEIIQSYVISGEVSGTFQVGGLVGISTSTSIILQSYGVSSLIKGVGSVISGLVGQSDSTEISQSYAVVSGGSIINGLAGASGTAIASYWDNQTSGRNSDGATNSSGQTTLALRSPTDYEDIYTTWDDGAMVDGINDNATIWCDEDNSGMIEDDERRGKDHEMGDNRVWDFGTTTDYPALRCTGNSLTDQRAWWYLNTTTTPHKPQLNTTRLNAYLDGSLP